MPGLAELLAGATLEDCVYAGFEFDPVRTPLRGKLVCDQGCLAIIEFSGDDAGTARHRAACISWMDEFGTRAWVDGDELPVPSDDGVPLGDPYATGWCAGRWFFIEIGGLDDHPRRDPSTHKRLGPVRGLLIHDADTRMSRIEYPDDSQLWTSPRPLDRGRRAAHLCDLRRGGARCAGAGDPAREGFRSGRLMEWMTPGTSQRHSFRSRRPSRGQLQIHRRAFHLWQCVDTQRTIASQAPVPVRRSHLPCLRPPEQCEAVQASHLTWPFGHAVQSPLAADRNAVQLTGVQAQPLTGFSHRVQALCLTLLACSLVLQNHCP